MKTILSSFALDLRPTNAEEISNTSFENTIPNSSPEVVFSGGFSIAYSPAELSSPAGRNVKCAVTNNCQGGNCVLGCGAKPSSGYSF
jgi:hypothetical protein